MSPHRRVWGLVEALATTRPHTARWHQGPQPTAPEPPTVTPHPFQFPRTVRSFTGTPPSSRRSTQVTHLRPGLCTLETALPTSYRPTSTIPSSKRSCTTASPAAATPV